MKRLERREGKKKRYREIQSPLVTVYHKKEGRKRGTASIERKCVEEGDKKNWGGNVWNWRCGGCLFKKKYQNAQQCIKIKKVDLKYALS